MAILSKEEFMNTLKERIGESTDDKDLKFLEDMTDTYNDLCKQCDASKGSTTRNIDWKQKFEENDAAWKQKYKDRFFSGECDASEGSTTRDKAEPDKAEPDKAEPEDIKLEDSFMLKSKDFDPDSEIVAGIAI